MKENYALKKKIIISIFSIVIISGLAIILYIKTDAFKTNEQLFLKYMLQEVTEVTQILSNDKTKVYNDSLKKSYYIKEGKISVSSRNKFIKPINIEINQKGNKLEENINTNLKLKYNNENMTELSIIKDKDYFIVKNESLTSDYIGVENKNLKQLAQKLGIENTDFIPNEIKEIEFGELFSISEEEKNHILKKYIPICRKNVKNKNYSKVVYTNTDVEKSKNVSYKVDISEKQMNKLAIEILKQLYDDDISLEFISKKLKLIGVENKYCDINNIKDGIRNLLIYFESKEKEDNEFISIIIHKEEKNVIKVELVLKNDRTISIQINNSQNKVIIKQYNVENKKINFTGISNIINTMLDSISEITYCKNIIGNNTNKVESNIIFDFGIEIIVLDYDYVEQIKNNVENILNKNDVEYIDIENLDKELYKKLLEEAAKIRALQAGKMY